MRFSKKGKHFKLLIYRHGSKNISKSLAKDEKLKSCEIIKTWHASIITQWWWALQTSVGNSALAKEKILSIFSHISGPKMNIFQNLYIFLKSEII